MPETVAEGLFALAEEAVPGIGRRYVGGGSDGNFTAALGVPTLDGLGAVGGRAHADHEFVIVDRVPERALLIAHLVSALQQGRLPETARCSALPAILAHVCRGTSLETAIADNATITGPFTYG
jgi:hypothetical protein